MRTKLALGVVTLIALGSNAALAAPAAALAPQPTPAAAPTPQPTPAAAPTPQPAQTTSPADAPSNVESGNAGADNAGAGNAGAGNAGAGDAGAGDAGVGNATASANQTSTLTTVTPTVAATPEQKPSATPPQPKKKEPWGPFKPCKPADSEDGSDLSTDCSGIFGLRAGVTRTSGVGPNDAMSLSVSTEGEEYVRRGIWTSRNVHRLAIGGGAAGFDGTLLGGWAGGVRLPIAPCHRHGPVFRLGMFGYLRGNDAYYGSLLELPQLQVGYQYLHGKVVVELGATAGAVLVGRSRTGDSERRVLGSGFERGGYLAIQVPWLRLGVSGQRLPVNDQLSTPVDVFEGTLCARIAGLALCGDARSSRTDAVADLTAPPLKVRSLYAGLTLGFTRE